jgi:hypothetical protein
VCAYWYQPTLSFLHREPAVPNRQSSVDASSAAWVEAPVELPAPGQELHAVVPERLASLRASPAAPCRRRGWRHSYLLIGDGFLCLLTAGAVGLPPFAALPGGALGALLAVVVTLSAVAQIAAARHDDGARECPTGAPGSGNHRPTGSDD